MDSPSQPVAESRWIVGVVTQFIIGGVLVYAWTSDWTTNGVYPLIGSIFFGIGLGMLVARLTRSDAWVSAFTGLGFGLGAFFLEHRVARIVLWVVAVGAVLDSLKRVRSRSTN